EIPAVPDMSEERRHRGLRNLVGIGERAVRERLEDAECIGMQAAEELEERLVASVLKCAQADGGVRVAGPALQKSHVRVGVSLHLQAGTRERDATEWRQRQPEREQLGTGVANDPSTEVDVQHRPGDRLHLEPELGHELPDHGIGGWEHMRADAECQVAALLRPDASADTLRRLEYDRVVIAEAVCRHEAGDPPADDDDVTFLDHGAALLRSSACGVAKPTLYTSESALRAG